MSSSSKPEFKFPWQYSFPPFFTLQPHAETRAKQLSAWRSLVLDYCQHGGIAAVEVADLARSPLFRNDAIGRRLDDKVHNLYLRRKGTYLNSLHTWRLATRVRAGILSCRPSQSS